jgi:two-component system response regulator NreC
MTKIRILLADDHPLVRSGLMALLEPLKEFQVIGEAGDGREAVALTKKLKPDVVVIDLSMPVMSGIEATRVIREETPTSKVLVLTMHENEEYVFQILRSGAGGYILKNCSRDELASAIRAVAKGEKFFSPKVSEMMVQAYLRKAEAREASPVGGSDTPLTPRESEVLACVAQGMTNQEVAAKLFISVRTVETHKTNIMQKLGIEDTAKLIRYAVELRMKHRPSG